MKEPLIPNFKNIEDKFWWAMCDAGMNMPIPLRKAKLDKPFVYSRKYGVFEVPFGKHPFALALLLAWELGEENYLDIDTKKIGISAIDSSDIYSYADYFLQNYKGTAYMSSQDKKSVRSGKKSHLNSLEADYFSPIIYLFD